MRRGFPGQRGSDGQHLGPDDREREYQDAAADGPTHATPTGVNGGGGGIENSGTLTLSNAILSNNSSASYNTGSATLTNDLISGNVELFTTRRRGRAASLNSGKMTLTNVTISGNSAHNYGGGIYNKAGMMNLSKSTFTGNKALAGGGILNSAAR